MRISLEQNKYADFSLNIPFWDVRTGEMLTLEMFVSYLYKHSYPTPVFAGSVPDLSI